MPQQSQDDGPETVKNPKREEPNQPAPIDEPDDSNPPDTQNFPR